jgi:hypothetical protein
MGIKNVRTATYVADTGKEFQLGDMSSSHLLNAIRHHQGQLEVILRCPGAENFPFLTKRETGLRDTITVLYSELAARDPDKDDEYATVRNFNNDRSY